jgi:hypothetical protein
MDIKFCVVQNSLPRYGGELKENIDFSESG